MLKLVTPYPEKAREVLLNYLIEIKTKTFSAQRAIHQGDVLVSAVAVGDISLALVRMAFATEKNIFPISDILIHQCWMEADESYIN